MSCLIIEKMENGKTKCDIGVKGLQSLEFKNGKVIINKIVEFFPHEIEELCVRIDKESRRLDKIAKDISELEDMPIDDTFYEACCLVAENVYELDETTARKVADIIQERYL